MRTEHTDEKDDGKKSKLDGLKRMTVEQLTELHDATGKELARRAKAHKKPMSKMGSAEFEAHKTKLFEGKDDDDGE
jgi:hypothetical protein